ncbi:Lipid-binding SYLF domain-containing protein [Humidesulfovibrio mexicanus]|jgi:lipid-binding SYLF domain-containing protein|uniref:Lipid-binding SYLF domain-containing protein n=1 Tax=Humidesulfovibrio mexicanus TaxID=147047 RepID=A0A239CCZ1_9BACT|nr:lipid-binding SYLF domain-containing protein [Humidesulfovibrio mexicanus]SNS17762.1 Lipid-binding SYLF domain-containing protein [Humidesulfovibrio mexicanus]
MRRFAAALLSLLLLGLLHGCYGAYGGGGGENPAHYEQGLVDKSAAVVRAMRSSPSFRPIEVYLKNARGVLILPSVIKAGFIYGGQGGNGVLLGREADGSWSSPAFYTLGGGSIGLQIGVQEAAIVLVFMNDKAFKAAIDTGLTLGADATVAAGTEGLTGEVASTHAFKDVYYFADVGGLFAGISLEGGVVHVREGLNTTYYGQSLSPRQIVLERRADVPAARLLKDALTVSAKGK